MRGLYEKNCLTHNQTILSRRVVGWQYSKGIICAAEVYFNGGVCCCFAQLFLLWNNDCQYWWTYSDIENCSADSGSEGSSEEGSDADSQNVGLRLLAAWLVYGIYFADLILEPHTDTSYFLLSFLLFLLLNMSTLSCWIGQSYWLVTSVLGMNSG